MLSVLAEGESYGPAITACVRGLSGGEVELALGRALSPLLRRLEEEGLIASRWEGRRRKWYSITTAGREALAGYREAWRAVQAALARLWGAGPA